MQDASESQSQKRARSANRRRSGATKLLEVSLNADSDCYL